LCHDSFSVIRNNGDYGHFKQYTNYKPVARSRTDADDTVDNGEKNWVITMTTETTAEEKIKITSG